MQRIYYNTLLGRFSRCMHGTRNALHSYPHLQGPAIQVFCTVDDDDWLSHSNPQPLHLPGPQPRRPKTPITALWRNKIGTCW
eukprot:366106-Chlamydomonas_euryale.AAC.12